MKNNSSSNQSTDFHFSLYRVLLGSAFPQLLHTFLYDFSNYADNIAIDFIYCCLLNVGKKQF